MNTNNGVDESKAAETPLPNSRKVYVNGEIHPGIRVPFREITLAPTKSINGEIEINEPVRVYDTSGPWGDPSVTLDPVQGLPPLRRDWILKRGDVDEIEGRVVRPIDDGYLSDKHSAIAAKRRSTFNGAGAPSRRKPLRASADHPVTQLWYARQGIITPEMEFIAIRENGKLCAARGPGGCAHAANLALRRPARLVGERLEDHLMGVGRGRDFRH